jgi:hypothetical protein
LVVTVAVPLHVAAGGGASPEGRLLGPLESVAVVGVLVYPLPSFSIPAKFAPAGIVFVAFRITYDTAAVLAPPPTMVRVHALPEAPVAVPPDW